MNQRFQRFCVLLGVCSIVLNFQVMASSNVKTQGNDKPKTTFSIDKLKKKSPESTPETKTPDYYAMIDNSPLASSADNPLTLSEIENLSDIVIKGTFLGVTRQVELRDSNGSLSHAVTLSSIRVDEVYSGSVNVGEKLDFFEPYFISKLDDKDVLTHYENYYPSEVEKSYIWVLNRFTGADYDPGFGLSSDHVYYSSVWCERGRYPIVNLSLRSVSSVESMSNRDLNLSPNGNAKIYKNIFNEVIDKYMKN